MVCKRWACKSLGGTCAAAFGLALGFGIPFPFAVGFVALFLLLLGLAANDLEAAPLLLLLLLVGFVVLLFSLYRCRLELKAPPIGSPLDFGAPVIVLVGTPTALVLAVADGRPTCCCESTRAFLRRGDLVCWPWKGFFLLRLLLLVCLFLFPVLWFVLVLVLVLGACAATAAVARLASGVVLLMVVAVLCRRRRRRCGFYYATVAFPLE